ncbi:MAG: hypothetical protein ABI852_18330, partial [Gemmatimonadaceae bacterium]
LLLTSTVHATAQITMPTVVLRGRDRQDSLVEPRLPVVVVQVRSAADSLQPISTATVVVQSNRDPNVRAVGRAWNTDTNGVVRISALPDSIVRIEVRQLGFARLLFDYHWPTRCGSVVSVWLELMPRIDSVTIVGGATVRTPPASTKIAPAARVHITTCRPDV